MQQQLSGVVHGNTIVLDTPSSLPDGQRVEVIVRQSVGKAGDSHITAVNEESPPYWWSDEDDRILEEIYQTRKQGSR